MGSAGAGGVRDVGAHDGVVSVDGDTLAKAVPGVRIRVLNL